MSGAKHISVQPVGDTTKEGDEMITDTYLDGEPIGRMRGLDEEDGTMKVDISPDKLELVQAAVTSGVKLVIEIPSTRRGSPTGPPRYKLTTTGRGN